MLSIFSVERAGDLCPAKVSLGSREGSGQISVLDHRHRV